MIDAFCATTILTKGQVYTVMYYYSYEEPVQCTTFLQAFCLFYYYLF